MTKEYIQVLEYNLGNPKMMAVYEFVKEEELEFVDEFENNDGDMVEEVIERNGYILTVNGNIKKVATENLEVNSFTLTIGD